MNIHFHKYQGTGNDFIIIDNRSASLKLSTKEIAFLCDRHFGVGADGLMMLENADGYDFKMVYYNADGNESTMCGNGGRCITAFAHHQKIIGNKTKFLAIDGAHHAEIINDSTIRLQMVDVNDIQIFESHVILNTGSPHYIKWVKSTDHIDFVAEGRSIRNQGEFMPSGINVNFVTCSEKGLQVRTYERGVEDETLSCGTGVTASAIASTKQQTGTFQVAIKTLGGNLSVSFEKNTPMSATSIFLIGPATKVFEGNITLPLQ